LTGHGDDAELVARVEYGVPARLDQLHLGRHSAGDGKPLDMNNNEKVFFNISYRPKFHESFDFQFVRV
jgi:hypothetical protein